MSGPRYSTLNDGCDGDSDGLRLALGDDYAIVSEHLDDYDYEHSYNAVFALPDGRYIHADCGGCSCGGSGHWSYVADRIEAERLIPEDQR